MEKLRGENGVRRRRLDAANEAAHHQDTQLEVVKGDIKRLNQKWKLLYTRTAEARSFLCREAAGLYSLRLKRKRSGKVEYTIGNVVLPNLLTDLNCRLWVRGEVTGQLANGGTVHPHTNLNVSLDHLAHLLVLVSHYLGLKLPNEIILSGRDNPFTSMRGLLNNRHMAIRPLYVESPLSQLSRENPTAHSKFVEGVSMLALDIAWLCFSQGLSVNEVEDASNIGHCMWKLLVAKDSTAATNHSFGKMSHATNNGFLASAKLESAMSGFKLRYNVIADRVRYTLQGETIVADWDMVPDAEKEDEKEKTTKRRSSVASGLGGMERITDASKPASTSGGRWTKIRVSGDAGDRL